MIFIEDLQQTGKVALPGFSARWGTACMFTNSGRNHRNFYIKVKVKIKVIVPFT